MAFYAKQKLHRCCLCRRCTARSCRDAQPELFLIFDHIFFHTHFQSVKSSLFIPFHTEIVNLFPFPLRTSISNLGFSAYFLRLTPIAWVFPVLYSLPHPLLATFLHLALPIWVFPLTFFLLHPPRGFFRSYILFRAHSPPHFSTSRFQFGFFCLLSSTHTHCMGFSGLIFSFAPTSLCHMIYFRKKSRTFILLSCV